MYIDYEAIADAIIEQGDEAKLFNLFAPSIEYKGSYMMIEILDNGGIKFDRIQNYNGDHEYNFTFHIDYIESYIEELEERFYYKNLGGC